ncbi:2171_t:CDS:2, partial [Acaulospora morrowiae]
IDVIRRWLIPTVKSFVQNTPIGLHNWRNRTQPGSSLLNARQFSTIVQVIELAKDYNSLLEILLWVLENSMEKSLFQLIIDTFKRHEMIWSAMGKSELILETLTKKNEKGSTDLCITKYLSSLLPETCGEKKLKLERDLQSFTFNK